MTHTARNRQGGPAWVTKNYPQIKLVALHILGLRRNASANASRPVLAKGLVCGPAEHDHCEPSGPDGGGSLCYFSVNFWFVRGMVLFARHLRA